jgi:gamma-glutamylcyclotransferase (GGCT)/AIG2-like uncharacterized protein YtfP
MLYFAYGSNMHAAQMKERCSSAKFVCRGKLPSHIGSPLRLGFAAVDVALQTSCAMKRKTVWSVVYELPENELENLDNDEDFRPGRPDDQNEYTRENHYVWREGDAKRLLLVARRRCETIKAI